MIGKVRWCKVVIHVDDDEFDYESEEILQYKNVLQVCIRVPTFIEDNEIIYDDIWVDVPTVDDYS